MFHIYRTLAVFLIIIVSQAATGTDCGPPNVKSKIAGTVYVDGRPSPYGTVQAWLDGKLVAEERCTLYGHYNLPNLDPGTYKLIYLNAMALQIGRETVVEVRKGRFEQVDIELKVQTEGAPD